MIGCVIVHYGDKWATCDCVSSIYSMVDHIVIVDNQGGYDIAPLRKVDVFYPGNIGYGAGCNRGAAYLLKKGVSHIIFLNNDLIVKGQLFVYELKQAFDITRADIVSAHVKRPNGESIYRGAEICIRGGKQITPPDGCKYVECGLIAGTAFAVRSKVWWEMNGFREDLFLYFEEQDFAFRARKHRYSHVCALDAVVIHEDHTRNYNTRARYYHTRNAPIVMSKHYGKWWLIYYWLYFVPVRFFYFLALGKVKCAIAVARGAMAYLRGERGRNATA